jgi:hypothetical protein
MGAAAAPDDADTVAVTIIIEIIRPLNMSILLINIMQAQQAASCTARPASESFT